MTSISNVRVKIVHNNQIYGNTITIIMILVLIGGFEEHKLKYALGITHTDEKSIIR